MDIPALIDEPIRVPQPANHRIRSILADRFYPRISDEFHRIKAHL